MKKLASIFIACLVAGTQLSCSKKFDEVTVSYAFDTIDTLSLSSTFRVTLIQDTVDAIKITGSKYYVDKTTFTYTNGHLLVETKTKNKWAHPRKNKINLEVHLSSIKRINAYETCTIDCLNTLQGDVIGYTCSSKLNSASLRVNCTKFYFWNNFPCGGKLNIEGTANELNLWNYALMAVDARNLVSEIASLENHSKGDINASIHNSVNYSIYGSGNIILHQQPLQVIVGEQSGTGTFRIEL